MPLSQSSVRVALRWGARRSCSARLVVRLQCRLLQHRLFATSSVCNVVRLQRCPFATLSVCNVVRLQCRPSLLYVVRRTHANLQYRQSTSPPGFWTSRPQRWATVATRLRQTSPSVSGPSATRKALGQSQWATSWWSAGSSARWLTRRLSGLSAAFWLVASLFARLAALWPVGGIVAHWLVARSAALWLIASLFARLAALWWQKGWWHAVSLHVFPNPLSFCCCCIVQLMSYALYFCFLGLLTLGAVPNVCTNNLRPAPFFFPQFI